jgi:hypothetical protein
MGPWITNLLRFKASGNDWSILAPGIRNELEYAQNPEQGITIVSEDHKALIAENILHKPYNRNSFIAELKTYFSQYDIQPENPQNLTCLYGRLLYADQVKPVWKKNVVYP